MAADSDSDDYVVVGTPIEMADTVTRAKAAAGAVARAPPVWQQVATDEQGRRRFHGAFTGGFSAGYFNTVGSKEGWTPSSFVSSRSSRRAGSADLKRDARDYMDDDERQELDAQRSAVATRVEFDTEKAHAEARDALEVHRAELDGSRPTAVPGPVPSDLLIVPAAEGVGVRLLRKLGWRPGAGHSRRRPLHHDALPRVKAALSTLTAGQEAVLAGDDADAHDIAIFGVPACTDGGADGEAADAGIEDDDPAAKLVERMRRRRRRWGVLAGALADDDDVVFPAQKLDTHGLGHDPFAGAEEFRAIKRLRQDEEGRHHAAQSGRGAGGRHMTQRRDRGTAFGLGIFEDGDDEIYGDGDVRQRMLMSLPTVADDDASDDEQMPPIRRAALGYNPERLAIGAPPPSDRGAFGLDGFVRATEAEAPPTFYPPPVVPQDFKPVHIFPRPLQRRDGSAAGRSVPVMERPPLPTDAELVRRCDTLAAFVARNGPEFEELARKRQATDPRFAFLFGGPGAEYYAWKRATLGAVAAPAPRPEQRSRPLTASERGHMLGETPLAKHPAAASTVASGDASVPQAKKGIAESDRAALLASLGRTFTKEEGAAQPPPARYGLQLGASRFAAGAVEIGGREVVTLDAAARPASAEKQSGAPPAVVDAASVPPVQRSVDDWGPEPLLCKRFGVPDPYKGRQRPVEKRTFRADMLTLPATAQAAAEAAPKFLAAVPSVPSVPAAAAAVHVEQPHVPAAQLAERQEAGGGVSVASDEVDDFFASLAAVSTAPGDTAPPAATAATAPVLHERRPLDLFQAIFEASDDDDDDTDEDDAPRPAGDAGMAAVAAVPDRPVQPPPAAAQPPAPLSALAAFAKEYKAAKKKDKDKKRHKERGDKHKGKHKHHSKKSHAKHKHKRRSRSATSESETHTDSE